MGNKQQRTNTKLANQHTHKKLLPTNTAENKNIQGYGPKKDKNHKRKNYNNKTTNTYTKTMV